MAQQYTTSYWIFWALVGLLAVTIALSLVRRHWKKRHSGSLQAPSSADAQILEAELRRGEISPEEYRRRVRELKRDQTAA